MSNSPKTRNSGFLTVRRSDVKSLCCIVIARDEKNMLKNTLGSILAASDQLVLVDTGSTDGTIDYVKSVARKQDIILELGPASVLTHGFGYCRNLGAQYAQCDWLHHIDADEWIDLQDIHSFRNSLFFSKKNVYEVCTKSVLRRFDTASAFLGLPAHEKDGLVSLRERHRRIYRRSAGFVWRGYIHEELYLGSLNSHTLCDCDPVLVHWHLSAFQSDEKKHLKACRYAWMLMRAFRTTRLREWTSPWWFEHYVTNHEHILRGLAMEFEEIGREELKYM